MSRFSILRIAIVLFLVPFCMYIFYVIFSHTRKAAQQSPSAIGEEKQGVTKIEKFEMKGLEQERTAFNLNAEKFTQLQKGLFQLEKIHSLVLYTNDNRKIKISGDKGTMMDDAVHKRMIIAEGNVSLSLEDGTVIQTQKLSYDQKDQKVKTEHEVTIKKSMMTAHSSSMTYDLKKSEITLSPDFVMEIPGKKDIVSVCSNSFIGEIDLRQGVLKGGVTIRDARSELNAAEAVIVADDKGEALKNMKLSGSVTGKSSLERSRKNLYGTFRAEIMEIVFEGKRLSQMSLMNGVSFELQDSEIQFSRIQSLSCDKLEMKIFEEKASKIDLFGNVSVNMRKKENGKESDESLSCDFISALLSKERKIENAHAEGKVRYSSELLRAEGEVADFIGSSSKIIMQESKKKRPTMTMDDWTVYAQRIEIIDDSELAAQGEVKSSYRNMNNKENALPLFEKDKVLFIASDFLFIKNRNDVLYTGNVRAWQEENSISAQELSIDLKEKTVEAHGKVMSRFKNLASIKSSETKSQSDEKKATQSAEVQSDTFSYSSEAGRAVYRKQVTMIMEDREVKCEEMEILFSKEGEAEKCLARHSVRLKSSNFSSTGDMFEYTVADKIAFMHGNADPVRVYNKLGKEVVVAPSLTFNMSDDKMSLISRDGGRTWITLD